MPSYNRGMQQKFAKILTGHVREKEKTNTNIRTRCKHSYFKLRDFPKYDIEKKKSWGTHNRVTIHFALYLNSSDSTYLPPAPATLQL